MSPNNKKKGRYGQQSSCKHGTTGDPEPITAAPRDRGSRPARNTRNRYGGDAGNLVALVRSSCTPQSGKTCKRIMPKVQRSDIACEAKTHKRKRNDAQRTRPKGASQVPRSPKTSSRQSQQPHKKPWLQVDMDEMEEWNVKRKRDLLLQLLRFKTKHREAQEDTGKRFGRPTREGTLSDSVPSSQS